MLLKAILGNLVWKIFFIAQLWVATFKIRFAVIFISKTHQSFYKIEPWIQEAADFGMHYYHISQTCSKNQFELAQISSHVVVPV